MNPVEFPEMNTRFGPPKDLAESQCMTIPAFLGTVERGSVEGAPIVVVAWQPDERELALLNAGKPIFLSMMGGLAPHFLTTSFKEATHPG